MTKTEKIFDLFVSKEENRQNLKTPAKQGDYCYASDSYALVRLSAKDCDFEIESRENPNFSSVFPGEQNCNSDIQISDIINKINDLPLVEETKLEMDVCAECNGTGDVEWSYESLDLKDYEAKHECPVCDGYGECEREVPTGKMIIDESGDIQIDGIVFRVFNIQRLIDVCKILECDQVTQVLSGYGVNWFKVRDFDIIIMSMSAAI